MPRSVLKWKEERRVRIVKSLLDKNWSCRPSLCLGPRCDPLDKACQVVWMREHSFLSPSGGRSEVYLEGIEAGLESSKI